jgi:hypothetical protein
VTWIGQSCTVTEEERSHRQWVEPSVAALGETRRGAVALAVASRHLAKLTDYLTAAGKDPAEAELLLEKAWMSLGGQEPLTPGERTGEVQLSQARCRREHEHPVLPAPRDVPQARSGTQKQSRATP